MEDKQPLGENTQIQTSTQNAQDNLRGLGGWLILVGIGIVLGPIRLLLSLYKDFWVPLSQGGFAELTTPGTQSYIPWFYEIIVAETIVNVLIVLCSFWMIYLFFAKRRLFPKVFIGLYAFSIFFMVADGAILATIFPAEIIFDAVFYTDTARLLIQSCVWVPYMLVSKRVKNTFVS